MITHSDLKTLADEGWVRLRGFAREHMDVSLLLLANHLGSPISSRPGSGLLDRLKPIQTERARIASLSRYHGKGRFPFHTDTAHWLTPARHLILGCFQAGSSGTGTLLTRFSDLNIDAQEARVLAEGVFLVKNGRSSWYANILNEHQSFVRFDPGCMKPATLKGGMAADMLNKRLDAARPVRIAWAEGDVLIVDNWRVFHGREAAEDDENRTLLRVLVMSQQARGCNDCV
jgi:alpha-ketoglutarate-dependent taurine dioxygenase